MARYSRGWIGLLFAVAAFLVTGIVSAQQDRQAPTFSTATKLVEVDVVARHGDGPATGLTKEDFTLFDNGKPQRISFFSVRSHSLQPAGPALAPLPAGAVSNRLERTESPANATILLFDQRNTKQVDQAFALRRVVKFLQAPPRGARIGVYTFGADGNLLGADGLRAVQEITDDAELLRQAAKNIKARDPNYKSRDTTGMTAHLALDYPALTTEESATDFRQVMIAIARHLANVPGRKSLLWVTTSFPLFFPEPPEPAVVDFRKEMGEGARALNDANVALYAVDARGLMGALSGLTPVQNAEFGAITQLGGQKLASPADLRRQMLRGEPVSPYGLLTEQFLAGLTGGLAFFNKSNAIEETIQAAIDDGQLVYTLGFYPAQEKQEGAPLKSPSVHDLKVEVDQPGVSLRYRKNYFVSKTATAHERASLEDLLKDSLNATQLELVAEPTPDPARPASWDVRATVDLHDVQLERQGNLWVGGVDISFLVEGSRNFGTITKTVEIPDQQLAAYLGKGIVVNHAVQLDAGQAGVVRGVLRIVAQDRATGAAGSVRVLLGKK
jgi:VWFA-related protein